MSLEAYKKKRSLNKTPEPEGKEKNNSGKELLFVIQKHAASHLHYDFRLELKGTLKSWAVPKGPSLNPQDKRLAMLVEDHPFDYKDFEGVIPKGNYGAGQVIIWDHGTYEPAEKATSRAEKEKILLKEFHSGSMRIIMHGKKIKGEFALVKSSNREENAWLLIKKTDRYATEKDITLKDRSVVSGKRLEDLAKEKSPKTWKSNRNSNGQLKKQSVQQTTVTEAVTAAESSDYSAILKKLLSALPKKKSAMPENLKPMLASLVDEPSDATGWIYEVKWDGYRSLAYLKNGKIELRSRNNNNFTKKFFPVVAALGEWKINAVVDGEIVVLNEKGLSDFGKLQNWAREVDGELVFYVFDILWLEGINLMNLTVTERRNILQQLAPPEGIIRVSESFETSGSEFFAVADQLGLEGIIAKKMDSIYIPNTRTTSWLKIKTEKRHEAIVAGYTRNEDSSKQFSALVLGVYDDNNELKFIGQVGTGFTDQMQTQLLKKMKPLIAEKSPFPEEPNINKPTRFRPRPPKANVVWLKPKLVCEVKYAELTSDGIMRHPSFQGLRSDKIAKDVKEEKSLPAESVGKEANQETEVVSSNSPNAKKLSAKHLKVVPESPVKIQPVSTRRSEKGKRKQLLNEKETTQQISINGHEIKFTNLDKIYWPKEKITKRDMINYYYQLAPLMLPYMKDRPQSLNRYPDGIHGESFYQKNVAGKVPDWINTHAYENTTRDGNKTFYVCTDEASLLYIANLGCIEMNPWHSRIESPENPDWCVIDLDPDTNSFQQVIETANVVKDILDSFSIPSFPKTSGSTGIHIYIPLGAEYTYEQSKQLAELIVTFVHEEIRSFTSLERSPAKRKGKIYLDFLQNRAIQTIAAPYSLRPKPGATASAPLHWSEIKKGLSIHDFTIYNMADRVKETGDLFEGVLGKGIDIAAVLEKISGK